MKQRWQFKVIARKLRKKGFLYSEIQKKVPFHKTTLVSWCKDIKLTNKQINIRGRRYENRLKGARANYLKRQKQIKEIENKAIKEIRSLTEYEFKLAGIALYWGEGSKKNLAISNSDPNLIRFIMKWFREVCNISNSEFRAYLYLHTGQNEKNMRKYWSEITDIPASQFYKTIFKKEGSASRKYNLSGYKGTIKIQISNEDLRQKICAWIERVKKSCPHSLIGKAAGS